MDVEVQVIDSSEKEYVKIGCHKVDERINEITQFVKSRQGNFLVKKDGEQYRIPITEVFYVEAVDDRTFVYSETNCYESGKRLYDFEERLEPYHFVRISKSTLVNLMKIVAIKPALNGRFLCRLKNEEELIISRKYVPEIKKKLKGEN
ncbi:MAG: LytTR family transcriptional regulator [Lachnospiraceae bacterium]|nr:LytTR family transcriptional regulator [Lachnospiraceae bacterium]